MMFQTGSGSTPVYMADEVVRVQLNSGSAYFVHLRIQYTPCKAGQPTKGPPILILALVLVDPCDFFNGCGRNTDCLFLGHNSRTCQCNDGFWSSRSPSAAAFDCNAWTTCG